MAKNDWIVAGLNNPDFTPYDFSTIADMDLNNTQMLSADEYLKSDFIKNHDMFKDSSGKFSEDKFRQYHQYRTRDFKEFQENEYPKGPQLDMFDTDRTKDSRVKDIKLELGRHVNPDRQAIGIEGVRVWSDPTQTKSEIAQSQKIWDTAAGKFKDYSSNDKALSNGLFDWLDQVFSDPLVMAKWEEDGEHLDPITGMVQTHKKGDYKLNDKGTYYYETLNNRSPIGKEVLSVFDTLTVDGQGINKYDFFDSDDIKKSVTGIITKNVVSLLPLFTPLGGAYSALMVAKEFSKAMPMMYGIATMLGDSNESPAWVNNVAAWGTKMSGGTSQYAKENTFSFENFGNLIADVALQWGQQKAIAQGIGKLRGTQTYIDDATNKAKNFYEAKAKTLGHSEELWQVCQNKFMPQAKKLATQAGQLGRDTSLAYMAIVSNSDLYNEMRNMGLTNTEAAAVALGSTLGMFGLNKYTGLGEIFFDDATDDAVKLARKAVKAEMADASEMFSNITKSTLPQPNKYLQLIKTASDKARKALSGFSEDLKYHTLNFTGKAVGEGLEEVSEELISDVSKSMYELAGQLGADTTLKDVGAWDNALERYTMSFLGGAIGGGIFYGREALFDGKSYKQDSKNWEMATLIRNGHSSELRAEVEKMRKAGKLGKTKLSASKYAKTEEGDTVWLTTDNQAESQNDAIANAMLEKITALETIINNNRINLTDDQLFDNMVFSEKRYKKYQEIAPLTNYYQDFSNITNSLIAAELDLKLASNTIEGTPDGQPRTDAKLTAEQEAFRTENLKQLQEKVDELRKQKDDFLAGETSLDYTRKLNFLIDPMLHAQFLSIDKNQFLKEKYGDRKYNDLTEEEKRKFEEEWNEKVKTTLKEEVNQSWQRYKEIEALITPELKQLEETIPEFRRLNDQSLELLSSLSDVKELKKSLITDDTQLEDESDEDFKFRKTKKTRMVETLDDAGNIIEVEQEESDEDFKYRVYLRSKKIEEYNTQKTREWVDKIKGILEKMNYKVDPTTFRLLKGALPYRQKEILTDLIKSPKVNLELRPILKYLKPNLSNISEIQQNITTLAEKNAKEAGLEIIKEIEELDLVDPEGIPGSNIYDILQNDNISKVTIDQLKVNESAWLEDNPELLERLQVFDGSTTLDELIQYRIPKMSKEIVAQQQDMYENTFNTFIADVKADPIYDLVESIKVQVKNPIGELIRTLSEKNEDTIPHLDMILDKIQSEYDSVEDVTELILDDTQMESLIKVRDYMKLIRGFMYAAASNPNKYNPVGHNQVINAFAKNNKKLLTSDWEALPEIDSDYYVLYNSAMSKYESEIEDWIKFSQNNNVNKIRKFVAVDRVFTSSLLESITSRKLKITIDDKEIDLLEGFINDPEDPEVSLFNAEQTLYNNFQKILKESKLSVKDFLKKTDLLTSLIPSIRNIVSQKVAQLSDTLKATDLTDYDLLQYFAQVFTLNPSEFYSELKTRVTQNKNVAPITAQEYAVKMAKAAAKPQFKEFIKYAYEVSESPLPLLSNTVFLPGVAGAGKTSVELSSIHDPGSEVIIAGPTKSQADALSKALHRTTSHTFADLFKQILGEAQLKKIEAELDSIDNTGGKINNYDGEYFTIKAINQVPVVFLKKGVLKFNKAVSPKQIILDEATHLSAAHLQILDAFAEEVGATNYLAGDPNQRGYYGKKSSIENIQEDQIFCIRAPKLTISLRDNNLQKHVNQENVRSVLDLVNSNILELPTDKLAEFWEEAKTMMSKFKFQVYNHDELNGDLITTSLEPDLLEKLKGHTLGFVGDNTSPYLAKLKEAGLEPKVMSMDQMQGREFDFVVIDHQWENPGPNMGVKLFLTDLYTSMTRATTASIFIDRGLSDIIGTNTISHNKSKAPSILTGVEELRERKLALLDKFKFDTSTTTPSEPEKPQKDFEDDFEDPEVVNPDQKAQKIVQKIITQDSDTLEEVLPQDFTPDGEQMIETFTDITILGATVSEPQEREVEYDGQKTTINVPIWTVTLPAEGIVRNLQAFYNEPTEFVSYNEKIEAQKLLFKLKSAVMFNHTYEDINNLSGVVPIVDAISEQAWNEKKFEIEIREVSDIDTTHLNAHYSEPGIEFGPEGNKKRYIVNIVCKIQLKNGKTAKFDISGLPSLDSVFAHKESIANKLKERIRKADGDLKTKLQNQLANLDATFTNYENLITSWIQQFEAGEFKPIRINEGVLNFNKTTWFQELKTSGRTRGIQLGGKLNPITGKSSYDVNKRRSQTQIDRARDTLQLRHPELVFSPIYTYASKTLNFEEISPSLKGRKAVVFVTSDATLKGEDLIHIYRRQKQGQDTHTAVVRMLVLDNYGMTFSQFIDEDFLSSFKHSKDEHKPLRQNYNGIRMFTALWNWRAGLIKFNNALEKWQSEHSYTNEQVTALTQAAQMIYDGEDPQDILQANGLSQTDLDNLTTFNTKTCSDVPIFRLGYSKNGNGFYVQGQVDVSQSSLYNNDKANLLAITPEKAKQFEFLVGKVLSSIEYRDAFTEFTIGARLLKPDGKTPWNPDELIDLEDATHRRTLSGLLSDVNEKFILQGNGQTVAYPSDAAWSLIPAYISNLVRTITRMQNHPDEIGNDVKNAVLIIPSSDGKEDKKISITTQIDDLFSSGHLQFGNDSSLFDMLDLAFHGTVGDIHHALRSGEQLLQLDDAYFKQGFFINPDVARVLNKDGRYETIDINDDNDEVLFYQIATSPELFIVDTDVRTSGIGIRINKLFEEVSEEKQEEHDVVEVTEEDFSERYPELKEIIDSINSTLAVNEKPFEYDLKSLEDIEELYNERLKTYLETSFENQDLEILDKPSYVTITPEGEVTYFYVRNSIATQLRSDDFEISFDGGKLMVKHKDKTYEIDSTLQLKEIKDIEIIETPTTEAEQERVSIVSKYDSKMSDGKSFRQAFPELLRDTTIQNQIIEEAATFGDTITKDDIEALYNTLVNYFGGNITDEEINERLSTLGNNDKTYIAFIGIISEEFMDILNLCI